jgi:prepilin-type N-terminal cleavage/methylation domain-containing protein
MKNPARPHLRAMKHLPGAGRARAFTLLEIAIALVLLGLLLVVATPGISSLTRVEMKKSASMIAGLIRDTYARTALSGHSARVVLDLEADTYWVEESDQPVRVRAEKLATGRDGKVELDALDDDLKRLVDSDDEKDKTKLQLLTGPPFKPVDDDIGKPQPLPNDVHFKSVWVEHLEDRATGGQVAIYFFPGGYVEEAHIAVTDDENGKDPITVMVNPLTAEISIVDDEPALPRIEED